MRAITIITLNLLVGCGAAPIEPIITPRPIPTLLPPRTVDEPPTLTLGHIDPPFVIPRVGQDYRVAQYLTDFENTYPAYTTACIPVIFKDATHFAPYVVAQCYTNVPYVVAPCHTNGVIEVNQDRWDSFSVERQRNMIWHELGHCLLRRPHLEGTYPDGCPISIMAAILIKDGCLAAHPDLIDELARNKGF